MVEMAQLRIAWSEGEPAPVLQRERHPPVAHAQHLGRAAVDQSEFPANAGMNRVEALTKIDQYRRVLIFVPIHVYSLLQPLT